MHIGYGASHHNIKNQHINRNTISHPNLFEGNATFEFCYAILHFIPLYSSLEGFKPIGYLAIGLQANRRQITLGLEIAMLLNALLIVII